VATVANRLLIRHAVLIEGSHDGQIHQSGSPCVLLTTILVPDQLVARDDGRFADSAHPGCPQSTSWTLKPSAKEQHKPFPLARRSNHGLSGEFVCESMDNGSLCLTTPL
jgi:hypothetical protein